MIDGGKYYREHKERKVQILGVSRVEMIPQGDIVFKLDISQKLWSKPEKGSERGEIARARLML